MEISAKAYDEVIRREGEPTPEMPPAMRRLLEASRNMSVKPRD